MLTEYYVDALIADEKAADAIWEIWASGQISDDLAALVERADWADIEPAPARSIASRIVDVVARS